jgi:hypothetical protein
MLLFAGLKAIPSGYSPTGITVSRGCVTALNERAVGEIKETV